MSYPVFALMKEFMFVEPYFYWILKSESRKNQNFQLDKLYTPSDLKKIKQRKANLVSLRREETSYFHEIDPDLDSYEWGQGLWS